jgi:hypothetical protein
LTTAAMQMQPSTRAQWLGVVLTLVASAALAFGLPKVADLTRPADTSLAAGDRFEASGVSIVPPEGWVSSPGSPILHLSKGGGGVIVFPPAADPTSPVDAVTAREGVFKDSGAKATIGEVATFTTDSGLSAAAVTIVQEDGVTVLYQFSDGTNLAAGQVDASAAAWADLQAEVDAMMKTVEITPGSPS